VRIRLIAFVSVGGAVLITGVLFGFAGVIPPPALVAEQLGFPGAVASVLLWPVTLCLRLAGPGPRVGLILQPQYEWTPAHEFAVALGLGLSWALYSAIALVTLRYFRNSRRRSDSAP
jgi:hypothetical protein